MKNSESFITVKCEDVYKACQERAEERRQRISESREAAIKELMNEKRWFFKPMTREKAIHYLQNTRGVSLYYLWDEEEMTDWSTNRRMDLWQVSFNAFLRGIETMQISVSDYKIVFCKDA